MTTPEIVLALVVAAATALACGPVLRRLPEPADGPSLGKTPYAALPSPGFVAAVGLACLAAGLLAGWQSDGIGWLGVSTAALAVAVDARTTWLPCRLAQVGWVLLAVGVAVRVATTHDPSIALRAALGAALGAALMAIAWRWLGVGFGDVRLMSLLVGTAAAHGWALVYPTLLAATACGAAWGVAHRLRGGAGEFPYGPGLWAGALLALALA